MTTTVLRPTNQSILEWLRRDTSEPTGSVSHAAETLMKEVVASGMSGKAQARECGF